LHKSVSPGLQHVTRKNLGKNRLLNFYRERWLVAC